MLVSGFGSTVGNGKPGRGIIHTKQSHEDFVMDFKREINWLPRAQKVGFGSTEVHVLVASNIR